MSMPNPYQQGPLDPGATPSHFPPAPDAQPELKKKGGCLKWGGAAVGAFVLIGIFTNIAGGDEDGSAAPATTTTTVTSSLVKASPSTLAAASPEPMTPTRAATTTALPTESAEESPEMFSEAGADTERVSAEFSSALSKANSYANRMHMSKQGVYGQLTSEYGEGFSADAAQYAIDNVQADWNANALQKARDYQDMNMSPSAIHDQLTSAYGEEFTQAQADYAIANL